MLESDLTSQPAYHARDRRTGIMRRTSLGMAIGLLVQYGLGMVVNLYVTVPRQDEGGGFLTAIGRALANGPVALSVHTALGLLLIVGAVSLVIRAAAARQRAAAWLSAVGLLAILGAAASGAGFVNSDSDGAYDLTPFLPGRAAGGGSRS